MAGPPGPRVCVADLERALSNSLFKSVTDAYKKLIIKVGDAEDI